MAEGKPAGGRRANGRRWHSWRLAAMPWIRNRLLYDRNDGAAAATNWTWLR